MSSAGPERAEIWWVDLDPTVGVEVRKTRPAVVLTVHEFRHLPIRTIVPLVTWQDKFEHQGNKIRVAATSANGLANDSAADVTQIRGVSLGRFRGRIGVLSAAELDEVVARVAMAVGFDTRTLGR